MDEKEIDRRIKEVDGKYLSPAERAAIIWECTQRGYAGRFDEAPESFDVMMFAIEYLGQMALAMGDQAFLQAVKRVNNMVYSMHYTRPEVLHGEQDRLTWELRLSLELQKDRKNGILKSEKRGGEGPSDPQ